MDDIAVQLNTAYNELGKELSDSRMRVVGEYSCVSRFTAVYLATTSAGNYNIGRVCG